MFAARQTLGRLLTRLNDLPAIQNAGDVCLNMGG